MALSTVGAEAAQAIRGAISDFATVWDAPEGSTLADIYSHKPSEHAECGKCIAQPYLEEEYETFVKRLSAEADELEAKGVRWG